MNKQEITTKTKIPTFSELVHKDDPLKTDLANIQSTWDQGMIQSGGYYDILPLAEMSSAIMTCFSDLTPVGSIELIASMLDELGGGPAVNVYFEKTVVGGGKVHVKVKDRARRVFEEYVESFRNDLENEHTIITTKYIIAPWHDILLALNYGVSKKKNIDEYEKAIWQYFPNCWINKANPPMLKKYIHAKTN